jgi:hypothetical protein
LCKIEKRDHARLLKRLGHFETMTVAEARSNNLLTQYDMTDCKNKAAKTRLSNQYDGLDSITRLTIEPNGSLRLHGILEGHEFHIVWWDPKHEIWPDDKQVR